MLHNSHVKASHISGLKLPFESQLESQCLMLPDAPQSIGLEWCYVSHMNVDRDSIALWNLKSELVEGNIVREKEMRKKEDSFTQCKNL